jgi:hypothetical protein
MITPFAKMDFYGDKVSSTNAVCDSAALHEFADFVEEIFFVAGPQVGEIDGATHYFLLARQTKMELDRERCGMSAAYMRLPHNRNHCNGLTINFPLLLGKNVVSTS